MSGISKSTRVEVVSSSLFYSKTGPGDTAVKGGVAGAKEDVLWLFAVTPSRRQTFPHVASQNQMVDSHGPG